MCVCAWKMVHDKVACEKVVCVCAKNGVSVCDTVMCNKDVCDCVTKLCDKDVC